MKILLIEDDELIAEKLTRVLNDQNYIVNVATDGQEGWELGTSYTYDLILLDIMLPKLDGISLCRQLRNQGLKVPILLLTAQDADTKKVKGLDAGADDYMTKPFNLQELLARIRALLRRGSSQLLPVLRWGNLSLDPSVCEVYCDRVAEAEPHRNLLHLTPKEYGLLELFLRSPHRVFSRSAILDHLWSFEETPGEETVTAHIKGLRQKLKAAKCQDPIETVYGIGYRLKAEPSQAKLEPPAENLSLSIEQQALSQVNGIWQRAKEKLSNRITVIEQATKAMLEAKLDDQLRQRAQQEAHKLVGSLGMFDLDHGSHLAQEIEALLGRAKPPSKKQLRHLKQQVIALRQELEDRVTQNESKPEAKQPLLLIVSAKKAFAQEVATEANIRGIRTKILSNATAAKEWAAPNCPDVVLLDLEPNHNDSALAETQLLLLTQLKTCSPAVPILVRNGEQWSDRLKIVRLGGRKFFSDSVTPSEILTAVTLLLQPPYQNAKISIIDDDPQIIKALRNLLQPWEIQLSSFNDPEQFWQTIQIATPDLVMIDLEMPGLSPIELCQAIRNDQRWQNLPILFLTAALDSQTRQKALVAGADDLVNKPIVGEETVNQIIYWLERSSQSQHNQHEIDYATGVFNYRASTKTLNELLREAKRHSQNFGFAILKVDHLQQINEQYDHAIADLILSRLGLLLRQKFPKAIVARWGGTEFILGMSQQSASEGVQKLLQLRQSLHQHSFSLADSSQLQATFSAGVVQYPQDGANLPALYAKASNLLRQAQAAGGDQIFVDQ